MEDERKIFKMMSESIDILSGCGIKYVIMRKEAFRDGRLLYFDLERGEMSAEVFLKHLSYQNELMMERYDVLMKRV